METKTVVIAVVEKENSVLMRKKPAGSPPYVETWYLFGASAVTDSIADISAYLKNEVGIEVCDAKIVGEDSEVKADHDGETKKFHYIDVVCRYASGTPKLIAGAEKIEWILKEKLGEYDLVPPSRKLFMKLGYLK